MICMSKSPNNKMKLPRMRSCFISVPMNVSNADINSITRILQKKSIETIVSTKLPLTNMPMSEQIMKAIRNADLFIAVINSRDILADKYFEIGYAYGRKKDILLFIQPNMNIDWDNIPKLPIMYTDLKNYKDIDFFLDQYLSADKGRSREVEYEIEKSHSIKDYANDLMNEWKENKKSFSEAKIEDLIVKALQASGITKFARSPQYENDIGADLVIWIDELEYFIGNPLIIEIKGKFKDDKQTSDSFNQIEQYRQSSNSNWALLISPKSQTVETIADDFSRILYISLEKLLLNLQKKSFANIIIELRNKKFHKEA